MSKFRDIEISSVTGAAILLAITSLLSRLVGLLRDRLFAHTFGAGTVLDAYYAAFRIPDFIYNLLVVGALSAGFIPVFLSLWEEDREKAWRTVSVFVTALSLFLLVLAVILAVAAPALLPFVVPGFSEAERAKVLLLTRILLISPIILGLSSIASSILQSFKLFFLSSLAPIFYNLGIILGVLLFVPWFGSAGLAYGVVLGACFHLGIQIPSLIKKGFRYRPIMTRDSGVKRIAVHMVPRMLTLGANQVSLVVATVLASLLSSGSIAIFNFAMNLAYVPIGMIGVSFATAAFPSLAASIAQKKPDEYRRQLDSAMRMMLFLIIPLTVIFLLLRAQIVRVVLGSGAFDWRATIETADTLAVFSASLFAQCLILLFARAFFALQNTRTPLLAAIVAMGANIAASIFLMPRFGVAGLGAAFSLSSILHFALLWMLLRKAIGPMHEKETLMSLVKISVAALLMGFTVQWLKTPLASVVDMTKFWGIFAQGAVAGIGGLFIYGTLCYGLGLPEMLQLHSGLKRRWLRGGNVPSEIPTAEVK